MLKMGHFTSKFPPARLLHIFRKPGNKMSTDNPIIVVDDDQDDIELIQQAMTEMNMQREVVYFQSGDQIVNYLKKSEKSPYLIICDVNLPGQDGFSIREQIAADKDIYYKSVPFIFW